MFLGSGSPEMNSYHRGPSYPEVCRWLQVVGRWLLGSCQLCRVQQVEQASAFGTRANSFATIV